MKDTISLISRIFFAQIFLISGFDKLGAGYAATSHYMAAYGAPTVLLPLVILLELGGGLAVLIGFLTRWLALALAIFVIIAALIFHHDFANMMQKINFMKNIAIAGGLLLLSAHGAGAYSVDAKLGAALSARAAK